MSCCKGFAQILREEFRLKKFGFSDVKEERFYTFQWRLPPIVYLIYRFIVAGYTFSWLLYTATVTSNPRYGWAAYLTNWSYTLLATYALLHFIITVVHYCLNWRRGVKLLTKTDVEHHKSLFVEEHSEHGQTPYGQLNEEGLQSSETRVVEAKLPFYVAAVWILFHIISPAALTVTMIFWVAIYPTLNHANPFATDNVQLHILNSVVILIEHALTAVPYRVLHIIFPIAYGTIYCIFSAIFWAGDHERVIYPILNWSKPGITTGYVLMIGFVVTPILHSLFFCLYRLKMWIYQKFCS